MMGVVKHMLSAGHELKGTIELLVKFKVLKKRVVQELHLDKIKHFNNICNKMRNQPRQASIWPKLRSLLNWPKSKETHGDRVNAYTTP